MNRIVEKHFFSEKVAKLVLFAPEIAKSRKPGHFVILRVGEKGERIPLTVAGGYEKGTIDLVVQVVGIDSQKLTSLNVGDSVTDIVGPLGQATHIEKVGTILAARGWCGQAPLLPIIEGFKKAGNKVISVLAARNKELIVLEEEVRKYSDEVIIMTDDGSYGNKGLVTTGMEEVIQREKIDMAIVIGTAIMMKFASLTTKKYNIKTIASLNTIMVNRTRMCGACRITVDGKTKFVCVDSSKNRCTSG